MPICGMNELKQYAAANDFEWLEANDAANEFDCIYEDEQGIAIIDKLRAFDLIAYARDVRILAA